MKRPMNKTSKCNACIAIATSAALCISPALAFAEDVDNVDGSSEAAASAPAENEVPPLEDEGSTSPESDSEQTDPDTQAITPAADSVTNEESQQRETINSYTWEFINVDTGERVLIGNFKIPFDSGVAKDTIAEYLPGSRYYGWDRRADSGGYLDWYIIYVVCPVNVPEGKQLAYNGTEQQGVESGSLYTLSGDYTATEIGTYTATATLKDGYKWTDGTTDPKQISWSIKQGTATKPTANTNLVYDGSEQMGVNEGEGYVLSGDYKATNAGKYYATATLKDGYVWSDGSTDPVEYTWTMTRAIATPPSAIPDLVYDGTEKTGLADDGVGYVLTEGSVVSATDAGTYTATVKPAENYKWITGAAGAPIKIEWSIAHASASKPTANTGLIYTGLPQKGVSGDGVGYTLSGEHKALLPGTYTATATLEKNYKWADGTTDPVNITWSIDYATVAKPEAATGLTYNESEQMGVAEGMGYTLEGHKATEPGTYTATATLKSGYVWAGVEGDAAFEPITIEWSIDYATVAKPEAATNLVYTGESQTGVAEGTGYTLSGDANAVLPGSYTATATLKYGYKWADDSTEPVDVTWTIDHATVAKPTANTGLLYDGTSQRGVEDGDHYTLSGDVEATQPGTYTATATPDEGYAWEDGSTDPVDIKWTLGALDYIAKPEANTGLIYDGTSQRGVEDGDRYTLSGDVEATQPGTYTAIATLEEGYAWEDGSIEPANIEWTLDPLGLITKPEANTGLVYNGNEQVGVDEDDEYTLSGEYKATEPGTYTAIATLEEGFVWEDGSTEPIEIEWSIAAVDPDEPVNPADPEDPANPKEKPEPPLVKKDAKESAVAKTGDEAPIAGLSLGALLAAAAAGLGLSKRKRDC